MPDTDPFPASLASDEPDVLTLGIYDAVNPRATRGYGNYSFFGQRRYDYPFFARGGPVIRLMNMGDLPHRFTIPSLDVDQLLAPEEIVDVPIDAPIGDYEWAIYEGAGQDPTATGTLILIEPGTPCSSG